MCRVLLSTIKPGHGGVPVSTRFFTDTLKLGGYQPVLGYYEPYSISPKLSVPFQHILHRKPGKHETQALGGLEAHAIGAWLPELEFTHYKPTAAWLALMDSCERFISVSGNILPARPFAETKRPFLGWVAAGWEEDRKDRAAGFPVHRKLLDAVFNAPLLRRLEKKILCAGKIIAMSQHTRAELNKVCHKEVVAGVLPTPVDGDFFKPAPARVVRGRIGFSGRIDDPRKNIGLLLTALKELRHEGHDVHALLIGGQPSIEINSMLASMDLEKHVIFPGYVTREQLNELLQTIDVFVVPSHQEGLCISALEAMACACPVISTRCGGPEEFVIEGVTGLLVDPVNSQLVNAISELVTNSIYRDQLGQNSRDLVSEKYSIKRCVDLFWESFQAAPVPHRDEMV